MGGHLGIGGVHIGLVTVRARHPRAQIVAYDDRRATIERRKSVYMGSDPVQQFLGREQLAMQEATGPEGSNKQFCLHGDLAAPVVNRNCLAREVDEHLFAGFMLLAHDDVEVELPGPVVLTELAVGVTVGECLFVLVPQQHQGDALAAQLEVDLGPLRHRAGLGARARLGEQHRF
jgi:hypothetical protein